VEVHHVVRTGKRLDPESVPAKGDRLCEVGPLERFVELLYMYKSMSSLVDSIMCRSRPGNAGRLVPVRGDDDGDGRLPVNIWMLTNTHAVH
jgi:hypothetical protein